MKIHNIAYRRKREGKTDYRRRLRLLLAHKPRLVVRRSLRYIIVQIITYNETGDKVCLGATSRELSKFGWNFNFRNTSAAYLLGLLIAQKAAKAGISEAVFDIGLHAGVAQSRIYAVLKGAVDNKLSIPHSEDVFPSDDRCSGKHIEQFAKQLDKSRFDKIFSGYIKSGVDPTQMHATFEEVKKKIIGA